MIGETMKSIGVAAGIATGVVGIWNTFNLPVPASRAFVLASIQEVRQPINSLSRIVMEGQVEQIDMRQQLLRSEKFALEQKVPADSVTSVRLGKIAEDLTDLSARRNKLSQALSELPATGKP